MISRLKARVGRKLLRAVGPALGVAADKQDETLRPASSAVQSWGIDGDCLQLGVYRGRARGWAMRHARRTKNEMRFFAFGTFTGLPVVDDMSKWALGDYACSKATFRETIAERIRAKFAPEAAAIVFVDCDLYESTIPILRFVSSIWRQGLLSRSTIGSPSAAIPSEDRSEL